MSSDAQANYGLTIIPMTGERIVFFGGHGYQYLDGLERIRSFNRSKLEMFWNRIWRRPDSISCRRGNRKNVCGAWDSLPMDWQTGYDPSEKSAWTNTEGGAQTVGCKWVKLRSKMFTNVFSICGRHTPIFRSHRWPVNGHVHNPKELQQQPYCNCQYDVAWWKLLTFVWIPYAEIDCTREDPETLLAAWVRKSIARICIRVVEQLGATGTVLNESFDVVADS